MSAFSPEKGGAAAINPQNNRFLSETFFILNIRPAFEEGIEQHEVDGIPMKVYNPEKTLADCFKYRNKIGLDITLEALKFYRQRKRFDVDDLMRYAKVCRVEKVMRPYVEATL